MQPINLHEVRDGATVTGLLLITSYTKKLDPTSKAPLNGVVTYQGKAMNFKIWDSTIQHVFNSHDLEGTVIYVTATAGVYRENLELTLSTVKFDHGFTDKHVFYKSVNVEEKFNTFVTFINANMSQKAVTLLSSIFKAENLTEPFKFTWAGMKMHDAQVGGLLNHTLKMLNLAKTLIDNDNRLAQWSDLIYLSIILHDIGKVDEIGEGGVYTKKSFVTHRTLGVEIITRQKQLIVEAYDEQLFYHILAVIQGHHGEYGDKPTTIWAYIIHLIDMLDAHTTGFLDKMTNGEISSKNGNTVVWANGENLVV